MSTGSRLLIALYAAVALWLAYCTVVTWGTAATWSSVTMAVAGLIVIAGIVRETVVAEERRTVAALFEREGRRQAWLDHITEALAQEDLGAACCERWWTSLGADHDADCVRRIPRRNVA